jgi:hypothetical protein
VPDEQRQWVIRDVDEETRTSVKIYATRNHLTIAEALKELVAMGLKHSSPVTVSLEADTDGASILKIAGGSGELAEETIPVTPERIPAVLQILAELVAQQLQKNADKKAAE